MTLWDAWQEGGVSVPWSRLAKSRRKKLFTIRKKFADYYLIGGRVPNKGSGDNEKLIILEVTDENKARLLLDTPGVPGSKFDQEILKEEYIDYDALLLALDLRTKRKPDK